MPHDFFFIVIVIITVGAGAEAAAVAAVFVVVMVNGTHNRISLVKQHYRISYSNLKHSFIRRGAFFHSFFG